MLDGAQRLGKIQVCVNKSEFHQTVFWDCGTESFEQRLQSPSLFLPLLLLPVSYCGSMVLISTFPRVGKPRRLSLSYEYTSMCLLESYCVGQETNHTPMIEEIGFSREADWPLCFRPFPPVTITSVQALLWLSAAEENIWIMDGQSKGVREWQWTHNPFNTLNFTHPEVSRRISYLSKMSCQARPEESGWIFLLPSLVAVLESRRKGGSSRTACSQPSTKAGLSPDW